MKIVYNTCKRFLILSPFFLGYGVCFGDEIQGISSVQNLQMNIDWLWTLIAAFMVFSMHLGFAMVESGFTRSKNSVNIIMKNLLTVSIGILAYWSIGFGLMYGNNSSGFFGTEGFFLSSWDMVDNWTLLFFLFQAVFCATSATIVSGGVAERTDFIGYIIVSYVISALVYPIFGSWAWGSLFHGGGWLENLGFIDFAGSTVVHSIGGWAALSGAIVVGPRIGKYTADGKVKPIPGHNIPLVAAGIFILWFGWYGFNVGSEAAVNSLLPLIAVNTTLAPACGVISVLLLSRALYKKYDAGMTLNGVLAGLVAVTAGCATMRPASAAITGVVAGIIVVYSVIFFDKLKIDDPVGAISVHGVCGAWGTLAAGIFNYDFASKSFDPVILPQLIGIITAFVWSFSVSFIIFKSIAKIYRLRVPEKEELEGLDYYEHGINAYPDFLHIHTN